MVAVVMGASGGNREEWLCVGAREDSVPPPLLEAEEAAEAALATALVREDTEMREARGGLGRSAPLGAGAEVEGKWEGAW
jgi:hypothetical protein